MRLLVIDGNSIINRAFYGIRALTNSKGVFTNAITGFMNIYLKLLSEFKPDAAAAAFDRREPTFRHGKYAEYKAGRKGMPDELAMQLPYVKELLTALGVRVIECPGYEADDILGTLSAMCEKEGGECILSTGDRDSFQLVTERVAVNLATNREDIFYTPDKIREVYGVSPAEMLEVKALMGDPSDHIPGVPGIGEKTALTLIREYHTVEAIYRGIDEIDVSKGVREKLVKGEESCRLSRWLGTIVKDAPIGVTPADCLLGERDEKKLAELLTELEMFTLLKKLKLSKGAVELAASKSAAVRAERSEEARLDPSVPDYVLIDGTLTRFLNGEAAVIPPEEYQAALSGDSPKRTFDLKGMLSEMGIEIGGVTFDTTLAAYLLNVNAAEYGLERLCAENGVAYRADAPASSVYELNRVLYGRLCAEKMERVLNEIEIPLAYVLVSMERDGIAVDREALVSFGERLTAEEKEIERAIYDCAGEEFNISSPKQLGHILFEKLGLPSGKKTKTGYSTNAEVLEELTGAHPIVELILRYRAVTKLNSTYAVGLLKVIGEDGRIHTTYKQTETRTGRISSAEPNIQNIPVRTERGREFRRFFIAREGYRLVDADYSQIELRLLAHISDDAAMIEAFHSGEDIHAVTASQVFNQPLEWVTPEMRSSAKAVNFGIVYGIGAFSLSKDIHVSVKQAGDYINAYLAKYDGVARYMERTVADAKRDGYVATMFGRRRRIPELSASNKNVQALGKRIAMNTPIQGTAADIIKLAMVKVCARLRRELPDARLILQVHDELIVEAKEAEAERAAAILREEMENVVKLSVPLPADAKVGKSWYEAH
ncbi:MAG: DNA polymerase I [Bacteroides sp.]|nr:DNA polymerase I [Eubacterium sp.]MCM1419248.1 DNA polymerase I [Roseburia sp.]MCM1461403.1 DNA polymerase I [Bacteroides sp.]